MWTKLAVSVVLTIGGMGIAAARPFTATDLARLDRLSDPHVSPDGRFIAYNVRSTDWEGNRGVNATLPSMSADAQTSPSSPVPEVTVTAPRPPTPQELAGSAVSDFIHVHAHPAVVTGQLARWRIGLCPPVTVGLSPRFNDFISARILAVAASVGAPVQEAGKCSRRNVYIVFATEPQRALDALMKQDPKLLGFHYHLQTKNLETISRPIQGWYVTSSRGAKGDETIDEADPLLAQGTGILDQGKHPAGLPGSRLTNYISSAIVNVIIVADANKMVGRAIGSIADYLAVLTLTQAFSSEQCGTLPSIMDMMLSGCGEREKPTGITAGDLAFLRALYQTDQENVLTLERGNIQNIMMRQFQSSDRPAASYP